MKPVIIGITGNERTCTSMAGVRLDAVSRHLSEGVKAAGGVPIILPLGTPDLAKTYIDMIDKLILSGGQNVDPRFYGEDREIDCDDYHVERDEFELALVKEALKQGKPIMAVCRGMQLLNVALGGTLNQKVENHWQNEYTGTSHEVIIEKNSRVSQLLSPNSRVNSIHRQSVKKLAPGLKVTARDPRDGTIEAYEAKNGAPLIGLQWHPELLLEDGETQSQGLFNYLVQSL
ncbi:gamma-glutamyl-gamma-aminobutyrate hydrolase family protein [Streptococcus hillyeri]|uniref:Gamma-glutamyl-gamma-aminobutyrate hydrolase family protein n=1 Tax=Streptococcus hillyeri TaxID=2282420 RepID=A0A3L9DX64_9STRE|nr:gamma-glutamyl-gamma-aminobutyrate hydrolase family protein [Streptococcus hillyeri]RLY03782.1 gamma-glutamyl-gamma-aminobutyrate hydrolase family protein [Streptococcus hillyeri]